MSETESFQLNIGVLRSQMTLQIHTFQASRLWYGRKPSENKPGIMGLSSFLALTNRIGIYSRQDDPYADLWMLRLEKKLDQTKAQLTRLAEEVDQVFSSVPSSFTLTENINVQPANLPIFASSHLGYLAIYILAQYDEIVRKAMLAHHIALIFRNGRDHWLSRGERYLRSLFTLADRYRYSGVTRKDFTEGNAKALATLEKLGEVPQDVMDGTRRSRFCAPLYVATDELNEGQENSEDSAGDQQQVEPMLTIVVPAESELDAMKAEFQKETEGELSEVSEE